MACAMLVGCGESEIGEYIKNYPETNDTVERLELNLYIITGDKTTENAKISVSTRISGYTKSDYSTVLNVHYVTSADYEATVNKAIKDGGKNTPHIILINSESMINSLVKAEGGSKLADLTDYYSSKTYGRLNTQIASSLLESSKIDGKFYSVPNNHVVDGYDYLVINKEVAVQVLHYTNEELSSYKSLEDAADLIAEMESAGYQNATELVRVVSGSYELREQLSVDSFCNVIKVPTVTSAEAFSSAFAVVNNSEKKYNDRAMQMIYAINTDVELRNMLQYGVVGANYRVVDGNIVRVDDGNNNYDMNILHTGDVFKADYCSEIGWTKNAYDNGVKQNKDSVSDK